MLVQVRPARFGSTMRETLDLYSRLDLTDAWSFSSADQLVRAHRQPEAPGSNSSCA